MTWWAVDTGWAYFAVQTRRGIVIDGAPIARKWFGRRLNSIKGKKVRLKMKATAADNPFSKGDKVKLNRAGRKLFGKTKFFSEGFTGKVIEEPKYPYTVEVKWCNGKKRGILIDYIEER
jgi:ribosomal protein L21E